MLPGITSSLARDWELSVDANRVVDMRRSLEYALDIDLSNSSSSFIETNNNNNNNINSGKTPINKGFISSDDTDYENDDTDSDETGSASSDSTSFDYNDSDTNNNNDLPANMNRHGSVGGMKRSSIFDDENDKVSNLIGMDVSSSLNFEKTDNDLSDQLNSSTESNKSVKMMQSANYNNRNSNGHNSHQNQHQNHLHHGFNYVTPDNNNNNNNNDNQNPRSATIQTSAIMRPPLEIEFLSEKLSSPNSSINKEFSPPLLPPHSLLPQERNHHQQQHQQHQHHAPLISDNKKLYNFVKLEDPPTSPPKHFSSSSSSSTPPSSLPLDESSFIILTQNLSDSTARARTLDLNVKHLALQNSALQNGQARLRRQLENVTFQKNEMKEHAELILSLTVEAGVHLQLDPKTNENYSVFISQNDDKTSPSGLDLQSLRGKALTQTKAECLQLQMQLSQTQSNMEQFATQSQSSIAQFQNENKALKEEVSRLSGQLAQRAILYSAAERRMRAMRDTGDRTETDLQAKVMALTSVNESLEKRMADIDSHRVKESVRANTLEERLKEGGMKVKSSLEEVEKVSEENKLLQKANRGLRIELDDALDVIRRTGGGMLGSNGGGGISSGDAFGGNIVLGGGGGGSDAVDAGLHSELDRLQIENETAQSEHTQKIAAYEQIDKSRKIELRQAKEAVEKSKAEARSYKRALQILGDELRALDQTGMLIQGGIVSPANVSSSSTNHNNNPPHQQYPAGVSALLSISRTLLDSSFDSTAGGAGNGNSGAAAAFGAITIADIMRDITSGEGRGVASRDEREVGLDTTLDLTVSSTSIQLDNDDEENASARVGIDVATQAQMLSSCGVDSYTQTTNSSTNSASTTDVLTTEESKYLKHRNSFLTSEHENAIMENKHLEEELKNLNSQRISAECHIARLEKTLQMISQERSREQDDIKRDVNMELQRTHHQLRLDQLNQKIKSLQGTVEDLTNANATLLSEKMFLEESKISYEDENKLLVDKIFGLEKKSDRSKQSAMSSTESIRQLQERIKGLENQLEAMSIASQTASAAVDSKQVQLLRKQQKISEQQLTSITKQRDDLIAKNSEWESIGANLKQQQNFLAKAHGDLETECVRLGAEVKKLKKQLKDKNEETKLLSLAAAVDVKKSFALVDVGIQSSLPMESSQESLGEVVGAESVKITVVESTKDSTSAVVIQDSSSQIAELEAIILKMQQELSATRATIAMQCDVENPTIPDSVVDITSSITTVTADFEAIILKLRTELAATKNELSIATRLSTLSPSSSATATNNDDNNNNNANENNTTSTDTTITSRATKNVIFTSLSEMSTQTVDDFQIVAVAAAATEAGSVAISTVISQSDYHMSDKQKALLSAFQLNATDSNITDVEVLTKRVAELETMIIKAAVSSTDSDSKNEKQKQQLTCNEVSVMKEVSTDTELLEVYSSSKAMSEIESLKKEIEEMSALGISKDLETREQLAAVIESSKTQIEELLRSSSAKDIEFNTKVANLTASMESEIESLKEEIEELTLKNKLMQSDIATQLETLKAVKETELSTLKNELVEFKAYSTANEQELRNEISVRIASHEAEVSSLISQKEAVISLSKTTEIEMSEKLSTAATSHENAITVLKKELLQLQESALMSEAKAAADYARVIATKDSEITSLKSLNSELDLTYKIKEKELSAKIIATTKSNEAEVATMKAEFLSQQLLNKAKESELSFRLESIVARNDTEVSSLQKQINDLELLAKTKELEAASRLSTVISTKEDEATSLKKRQEELECTLKAKESELKETFVRASAEKFELMQSHESELRAQSDRLQKKINDLLLLMSHATSSSSALATDENSAESESNRHLKSMLIVLESDIAEKDRELVAMKSELVTMSWSKNEGSESVTTLTDQVKALSEQLEAKSLAIKERNISLNALESRLKSSEQIHESIVSNLKVEIVDKSNRCEKLTSQVSELQARLLEDRSAFNSADLAAFEEQVTTPLRANIAAKELSIEGLRTEINDLRNQLQVLQQERLDQQRLDQQRSKHRTQPNDIITPEKMDLVQYERDIARLELATSREEFERESARAAKALVSAREACERTLISAKNGAAQEIAELQKRLHEVCYEMENLKREEMAGNINSSSSSVLVMSSPTTPNINQHIDRDFAYVTEASFASERAALVASHEGALLATTSNNNKDRDAALRAVKARYEQEKETFARTLHAKLQAEHIKKMRLLQMKHDEELEAVKREAEQMTNKAAKVLEAARREVEDGIRRGIVGIDNDTAAQKEREISALRAKYRLKIKDMKDAWEIEKMNIMQVVQQECDTILKRTKRAQQTHDVILERKREELQANMKARGQDGLVTKDGGRTDSESENVYDVNVSMTSVKSADTSLDRTRTIEETDQFIESILQSCSSSRKEKRRE